jgi:hypothetical protein
MSQMLADLGGGVNDHEPVAELPYDCPPWLLHELWAIANDANEPTRVKIEALKLLAMIYHWYEPDEDDFPISSELVDRVHHAVHFPSSWLSRENEHCQVA